MKNAHTGYARVQPGASGRPSTSAAATRAAPDASRDGRAGAVGDEELDQLYSKIRRSNSRSRERSWEGGREEREGGELQI